MSRGLIDGVAAMRAAERQLEAIAHNLANSGTSGFKRKSLAVTSFAQTLDGKAREGIRTVSVTDRSQGHLRETGRAFDLALSGPGSFVVETPSGEGYTRNGHFNTDKDGNLVSQEGFPVAWDGPRGRVDPVGEAVSVDPTGTVWQGPDRVGDLQLASFSDEGLLRPGPHGYLVAPIGLRPGEAEAEVMQGRLEASNVQPVDELVSMITVQRRFETATRLLSMIDQSYRRLSRPR